MPTLPGLSSGFPRIPLASAEIPSYILGQAEVRDLVETAGGEGRGKEGRRAPRSRRRAVSGMEHRGVSDSR